MWAQTNQGSESCKHAYPGPTHQEAVSHLDQKGISLHRDNWDKSQPSLGKTELSCNALNIIFFANSFVVLSICRELFFPTCPLIAVFSVTCKATCCHLIGGRVITFSAHEGIKAPLVTSLKKTCCVAELLQDSWTDSNISGWLLQAVPL